MAYKVKLQQFEGPFDLLVYLIENAKMSIYDIEVSQITSQYLKYIEQMQKLEINIATEFMVLAASLIEIKSKMLLPRTTVEGEIVLEEDPREELVQKILEYKKFKKAAELLTFMEEENRHVYTKPQEDLSEYVGQTNELLMLDMNQFINAFNQFIIKKQKEDDIKSHFERTERIRITSEARIQFIKELFRQNGSETKNFFDLVPEKSNPFDVALSFTSLLEMVKQKRLLAEQKVNFGDILVKATDKLENPLAEEEKLEEVI